MQAKPAPTPCAHIAAYYQRLWEDKRCIAYNLLRHGYAQWARGDVPELEVNNLYDLPGSNPHAS